jgi:ammonium transporter, Amt family
MAPPAAPRAAGRVIGPRAAADDRGAGLDISEHGMYAYPEQFIPAPEPVGCAPAPGSRDAHRPAHPTTEVPAS